MLDFSLRSQLEQQLARSTGTVPRLYRDRGPQGLVYRCAAIADWYPPAIAPEPWQQQSSGYALPQAKLWQWLEARSQPWPSVIEALPANCPVWPLQLAHARCWQRQATWLACTDREPPLAESAVPFWPVMAALVDLADVWQGSAKPVVVIARDRLLPALDQLDRQPLPMLPRSQGLALYKTAAIALAACLQRWQQAAPRHL